MGDLRGRRSVLIAALGAGLLICACQDDDPGGIGPDPDCIGPAGGTVAVTDPDDPLYGVTLSVAPGAWDQCWSVYLGYRSTFSTPNFPDGIEGYEGWLTGAVDIEIGRAVREQWIDAPDSLAFELTFPLRGLTAAPGEKIMAFRYDEDAGVYRLAVPLRLDSETLTVRAGRHHQLWTWGKVDLEEVDFDTYLVPVMEELHGEGAWLEIEAELQRLHEEALAGQAAITCQALQIVRGAFAAAGETAADNVRAIQDGLHGACGTCDATTEAFYDELAEYLKLNVGYYLSDLFLVGSRNVLVSIYGMIMCGYLQYCILELDCDYECFVRSVDAGFYVQLAYYYACHVVVGLIDWAIVSGYVDCPAGTPVLGVVEEVPAPAGAAFTTRR